MQQLSLINPLKFTVKKDNVFMCLSTDQLKFLDLVNFLAPGFSYDKYLKAYDCTVIKGYLPYEWIDSLEKLNYSKLPQHEDFFSELKNRNITTEQYAWCKQIWTENNMSTFKDYLIWYNNCDVKPFLEALEKQLTFYKNLSLDMFKDGISVPGLTLKYLFKNKDAHFT